MIYNDAAETSDRNGSSQAVNVNVLICRLPSCMHVTSSTEEWHVTARPWLQRTMFQNIDPLQPLKHTAHPAITADSGTCQARAAAPGLKERDVAA